MKRAAIPLLSGVLLLTLQTTLLPSLPIQRIRPDLVLILTLYWGLYYPTMFGALLALFMGYLVDLFSGNAFGLYALSRSLLFLGAQLFRGRFYLEGVLSQILFALLFVWVEGVFIAVVLSGLDPNPLGNPYPLLVTFLLPQSFFTALGTPLLFVLFKKLDSYLFDQKGAGVKGGIP